MLEARRRRTAAPRSRNQTSCVPVQALPAVVDDPVAQQQLRQPVPRPHQITAAVLPGPHQIPGRFLLDARHRHRDDLIQMQQPGQMQRIPGIGLHPIPGRPLQLRRRRDHTPDPRIGQVPGQPEAGRARLIGHRHRGRQRPTSTTKFRSWIGVSRRCNTSPVTASNAARRRPIGRAHPARHSYARVNTGASHHCRLYRPGRIPVGNPRTHGRVRPRPATPNSTPTVTHTNLL